MMSEEAIQIDDKVLLILAAKAMGVTFEDHYDDDEYWLWIEETQDFWNPLADDGDALRLMVELMIHVRFWDAFVSADTFDPRKFHEEMYADDRCAAARRAIVIAAAEMGREMK